MMKKKFPPFCVHFYKHSYTDFPISSPLFATEKEALYYAATHYLDYDLARLGFWTAPSYPEKYFSLEPIVVQCSLF